MLYISAKTIYLTQWNYSNANQCENIASTQPILNSGMGGKILHITAKTLYLVYIYIYKCIFTFVPLKRSFFAAFCCFFPSPGYQSSKVSHVWDLYIHDHTCTNRAPKHSNMVNIYIYIYISSIHTMLFYPFLKCMNSTTQKRLTIYYTCSTILPLFMQIACSK